MPAILGTPVNPLYQNITSKGVQAVDWRNDLLPAMFRGMQFHCESNRRENGTHVVTHQFPKRDIPYSESMGRRAYEFSLRGYCICYPFDTNQPLYMRDYRIARNNLIQVLEAGQPGVLQLPSLPAIYVLCQRYSITEEERFGGYCVFDMSFVEYGVKPVGGPNTQSSLISASETLKARVSAVLAQGSYNIVPASQITSVAQISQAPAPIYTPTPSTQVTNAATGRQRSGANPSSRVQSTSLVHSPSRIGWSPSQSSVRRPQR